MFKNFYLLLIVLFCCGCAFVGQKNNAYSPDKKQTPAAKEIKPPVKPPVADGIIFGKADFQGVLKVEYVKLLVIDENSPGKEYELFFGDRNEPQPFFGQAPSVEPKYFFLELPAGQYKITLISIPVGTTLATEKTDIAFTVEKETVIYLGTLRVTGTDQKIRFGGVPLLRPGFDYKINIANEKEEAIQEFKVKYPLIKRDIQVNLMKEMRIQAY